MPRELLSNKNFPGRSCFLMMTIEEWKATGTGQGETNTEAGYAVRFSLMRELCDLFLFNSFYILHKFSPCPSHSPEYSDPRVKDILSHTRFKLSAR